METYKIKDILESSTTSKSYIRTYRSTAKWYQ
nr:MAG TPA: hypothetical protein [Caudoviricetes sp.]